MKRKVEESRNTRFLEICLHKTLELFCVDPSWNNRPSLGRGHSCPFTEIINVIRLNEDDTRPNINKLNF